MKKIYFVLAVLMTAMLTSCLKEKLEPLSNELSPLGENDIAFVLGGPSTKSMDKTRARVTGINIPLGTDNQGNKLCLEETIEDLNPNPDTKGAPAYTVNVGTLYPSMGVYADPTKGRFGDENGNAVFSKMDMFQHDKNATSEDAPDGWRYRHEYNNNPWLVDEKVDFYLRLPATQTGVVQQEGATSLYTYSNGSTTFNYESPKNGAAQQDILFGYTSISRNEHDGYLPNGAPVTMYHALTGIKFRNGHTNNHQTKTVITRVEIIGLKGSGIGTANADGTFDWPAEKLSAPSTESDPFILNFANPTYNPTSGAANPDGTISPVDEGETAGDYNWNSNLEGTSWTSAAADHNLNAKDGSLTFWFIPQEITNDVILKVYFTVKTPDSASGFANDACHIIKLGELLTASGTLEWKAGELRTYTLKPFDVDVEVGDSMKSDEKTDLRVANTGNVDEYVRMLIMGNWYGWLPGTTQTQMDPESADYVEPSILVGYKYRGTEEGLTEEQKREMVLPWFREGYDLDNNPSTPNEDPYGYFDSSFTLANLGTRNGKKNDWADASGGFYYTMPIGPGEKVSRMDAATKVLFNSYKVTSVPTIYVATEGVKREAAVGVHLVMEIVVQAIAVPENSWWLKAWYDATGIAKLDPDDSSNSTFKALYENGEYGEE